MAGPGDEITAGLAGRGHLRASHADREQVISVLKAAVVQGRLDKHEFDLRVGQAFAADARGPGGPHRRHPSWTGRRPAAMAQMP